MKHLLISILLLAGVASAGAQPVNSAAAAKDAWSKRDQGISQAYDAFKQGNANAALAIVAANVQRGAGERDTDLQVADQFAAISSRFNNEGNRAMAGDAAARAIASIETAKGRVSRRDGAAASLLAGQLYELSIGDLKKAKAAYESAVAQDPDLTQARERLDHLNAVAARAKEKAAANDLLRARAKSGNK